MAQLFGRSWTRSDLLEYVGRIEQIAGVTMSEAADGAARGMRVLEVTTGGGLSFRVLPDRALDIGACRCFDVPIAWQSAVGEVHPAFYEAEGFGWLRTFGGGLLATCGLDQFGAPAIDQGEAFGIHGRIGATPAYQVAVDTGWDGDEYILAIRGHVRQARVFGENLRLERHIRTMLGSTRLDLHDYVTNDGYTPQPHLILYHFNFGFPVINPDARLILNPKATHPRDPDAQAGLDVWDRFQPPAANFREQVFRHELQEGSAVLISPLAGVRVQLDYDAQALPHLFQWKMMGQGIYVCGLEPANSSAIQGRAYARAAGDLPILQPGETRAYRLSLTISRL